MRYSKIGLCFGILLLSACEVGSENKTPSTNAYFPIKSYFTDEAARLADLNPMVVKTVGINGKTETARRTIPDWKRELGPFIEADINKNAWKGVFKEHSTDSLLTYTSNDEKIPVKLISIGYDNNKPKHFLIVVRNKNSLYTSIDSLTYIPDSLYQVKRTQKIRLLPEKRYTIDTRFR